MGNQNQNGIIEGNNTANNCATAPQANPGGLKGFIDGLHRKYDMIRYSKAGKWVMRGLTALIIGGTAKVAYDKGIAKGKASVVPTVVTVEPIPAEGTTETPAEEKSEVETAE